MRLNRQPCLVNVLHHNSHYNLNEDDTAGGAVGEYVSQVSKRSGKKGYEDVHGAVVPSVEEVGTNCVLPG